MILRWLSSKTVRQTIDLCHRVKRITNAQRDALSPEALAAIDTEICEVKRVIREGGDRKAIDERSKLLEAVANKYLKPYPSAAMRENIDMVLVALVVALGIRTFFLQPMAIPTGSMQPTLFGITHEDLRNKPEVEIPRGLNRFFHSFVHGTSYYHVQSQEDGVFQGFAPPQSVFLFVKKQQFLVGQRRYTVWFPPDRLNERAGLSIGQSIRKGEDIIKLKVTSGDRLFADRFTYNFRRPTRGEIIIFTTQGIEGLQQDTHYIKRLVGLGGEKIQIGNDRHAVIDGIRLDAATPRFENLYSFDPSQAPRDSRYSGHVNGFVAKQAGEPEMTMRILSAFQNGQGEFSIPAREYFALGDNTMNSYDSRYWGSFPQDKVIGKCAFVFWPISSRFGWAVR